MPKLENARSKIMETAQHLVQTRGVGGFSFRDIAGEINIKSASIHYHFPTKDDLIIAIAKQYREEFSSQLQEATQDISEPKDRILIFVDIVRNVLIEQSRMCLCIMLAADAELMSEEAKAEVKKFYNEGVDWLTVEWKKLGRENPRDLAIDTFVRLEGGLLISRAADSIEPLDVIKRAIAKS